MTGLLIMIAGLILFIGGHAISMKRELRGRLVARLGAGPFKVVYSLIAFAGVGLIGWGFGRYRAAGWIDVWYPPIWTKHIAALLVLIALILIVASYVRGHIYVKLKHPMLAGTKLWAVAHLLANGDLGSIILFGSILGWAVADRISLKRRTDPGAPPMAQGGLGNDLIAGAIGCVLYLALAFVFHPVVIGVPVFGG